MSRTDLLRLNFITISAIILVSCHTSKKTVASAAPPASTSPASTTTNSTSTTSTASPSPGFEVARSSDGIYSPGNEEVIAIQRLYPGERLDRLKEGYELYTKGACINCHRAFSIYNIGDMQWKPLIDDMARKAMISYEQKDAVYKYVLAIKAVQHGGK